MLNGGHFDRSVVLPCVRRHPAYNLNLRELKEMMAERSISVDHTPLYRWSFHYAPLAL